MKRKIQTKKSVFILLLSMLVLLPSYAYVSRTYVLPATFKVTITFKKIRSTKGKIQLQIYRNQSSFAAENPYKEYHISKSGLSNGMLTYTVELPAGTYGFALLDDENNNKEMDYSFFMPKEGFGFSDYYHTSWSRPVFSDFKFELSADKKITMVTRYV